MDGSTLRIALCLAASAFVAAGCGDVNSTGYSQGRAVAAQTSPSRHGLNVSVLRSTIFDYDHKGTPEELVKARDHEVIATGTVEGFEQGRDIYTIEGDPYPDKRIVMQVKVEDSIRDRGLVKDGYVYVDLDQGGVYHDGTPRTSLGDFRKAVPSGTKIMLFLFKEQRVAFRIEGEGNGLPEGAHLATADPQGIIFDTGDQLVGGQVDLDARWGSINRIDVIADRVRNALKDN